jgi:hypothetical protein
MEIIEKTRENLKCFGNFGNFGNFCLFSNYLSSAEEEIASFRLPPLVTSRVNITLKTRGALFQTRI